MHILVVPNPYLWRGRKWFAGTVPVNVRIGDDDERRSRALKIGGAAGGLAVNTLAFTVCFAVWMMNGVLVTFLVDNGLYKWDPAQMGWLIGIPVVTGSLFLAVRGGDGPVGRTPGVRPASAAGGRAHVPVEPLRVYLQFCLASLGFKVHGNQLRDRRRLHLRPGSRSIGRARPWGCRGRQRGGS